MCRICSYYTKIDVRQLATSNPFLDGTLTPTPVDAEVEVEVKLPTTIIIESPDSSQQTAWTNLRRFPSLYRAPIHHEPSLLPLSSASSSQITPRTISIYGPREMSKFNQDSYNTFGQQNWQRNTHIGNSAIRDNSFHRKLQHHNRVNSSHEIVTDGSVSGLSSQSSTPRDLSPVSDEEEFAYLPSSVEVIEVAQPRIMPIRAPADYTAPTNVTVPKPLNFNKYKDRPSAQWM